jgi:Xaa-Pro aminopeptidase
MAGGSAVPDRLARLREALERAKLDALLVTAVPNVTYLSGFTGDDSALLVTRRDSTLITDGRYTEQAGSECPEARVLEHRKGLLKAAAALITRRRLSRVAFEDSIPHGWYLELRAPLSARRLVVQKGLVERQRMVKDAGEVALIRQALAVAQGWWAERRDLLRPGRTEREVAADLVYGMERRGAQAAAFSTIVAEGPRASLPHAQPTARRLSDHLPVLLDWGAQVGGYKCDLTRVLVRRSITGRFREVYRLVLEAQEAGIAAVRPGVSAGTVDRAARSVIRRAGYGRFFGHGLGHGVGLDIHELPRLRRNDRTILEPGMVVTIEPGVYLPGRLGVRIEDMVLVTPAGGEVLSSAPKRLDDVNLE